jgi:GAF domain-containing protein
MQSLNKKTGDFTTDDMELLNLAARMVTVAINNSKYYNQLLVTNKARIRFIKQITDNIKHIALT